VFAGAAGGSGTIVFRYLTSDASQAGISVSGGTVTTSGGYTIHSFTSSGTVTVA
jgi:outer membrane usher protein FimD/PapC